MCIFCAQAEANTAIGVDLGTSSVRVAVWQESRVEAVPNDRGQLETPSSVAFLESGERLVGAAAHVDTGAVTRETVRWAPRMLVPRDLTVAAKDCKSELGPGLASNVGPSPRVWAQYRWPVRPAPPGRSAKAAAGVPVEYSDETQVYTPEQVVAIVLGAALGDAETYLGTPPTRIVVTVPTWFGAEQHAAVLHACHLAHLEQVELLDHSTAASIAHGLQPLPPSRASTLPQTVLMLDLGGGSLDVCLLAVRAGGTTVAAVAGAALGGVDWDARIAELVWRSHGAEARAGAAKGLVPDLCTERRLRVACEQARCELSSAEYASIPLPLADEEWEYVLTRSEMEIACADLFAAVLQPIDEVLRRAHVAADQVDQVVLLGGASCMPRVQQLVAGKFSACPMRVPNESEFFPAYGAAVQSAILDGVTAHHHTAATAASTLCCAHQDHGNGHGHGHGHGSTAHQHAQEVHI